MHHRIKELTGCRAVLAESARGNMGQWAVVEYDYRISNTNSTDMDADNCFERAHYMDYFFSTVDARSSHDERRA